MPLMKDCHSRAVKVSTGPSRCLESRTATIPGRFPATSTHAPPLLLRVLLRHTARDRSTSGAAIPHLLDFEGGQASSAATPAIMLLDSSGSSALATRWLNIAW